VVCQQVVQVETGTADGRSVIQTSMRAMPIVLMEPARQFDSALLGVVVSATVGPFAQSGLDEAFGRTHVCGLRIGECPVCPRIPQTVLRMLVRN
jgi:hypothetical protein